MKYIIDGQELDVIIKRNKLNQKTYYRIKNNCIYVTTARFVNDKYIYEGIKDLEKEITVLYRKYLRNHLYENEFWFLGYKYDLIKADNTYFEGKILYFDNKFNIDKFYLKEAKRIFKERLEVCHKHFNQYLPLVSLTIRKMKTRWGVCNTRTKRITLNLNLIRYDINVIDYVIIHELSHLIEANHSSKFWDIVKSNMPEYKNYIRVLKGEL